jgi:TPR repeat protein
VFVLGSLLALAPAARAQSEVDKAHLDYLTMKCGSSYSDAGESCASLAEIYATGKVAAKDPAKAEQLYKRALHLNTAACDTKEDVNEVACVTLARAFEGGLGTPKDPARALAYDKKAHPLLQKACDEGRLGDCELLASAYENGRGGLPKDAARAAALFKKACDAGDQHACDHATKP